MRLRATTALVGAVVALAPACASGPETASDPIEIRLHVALSGARMVDVVGLSAEDLAYLEQAMLTRDGWLALLRVEVASAERVDGEWPAVLGSTTVSDGVVRFTPQFPLDPGQLYAVTFDASSLPSAQDGTAAPPGLLRATVEVPAPVRTPSTQVVAVYPTGPEVPENHLRLYIVFSAPMSSGGGEPQVRVIDDQGREVPDPFLPLALDLWNDDRTRFTVLYDPGRVKRGIRPNAEMGRALVEGRTYTLVVDAGWHDAEGQPLASAFRREFRVGPPRERAIDPAEWQFGLPAPGTRDPLAVTFAVPLDYGLLHRALRVVDDDGRQVDGAIQVDRAETRWRFTPRASWRPGEYRLVVASTLEDVAGNRIGRPFEVAIARGEPTHAAEGGILPFSIERAGAS